MPLNQSLVGKVYPPIRYEVGREKLREFAVAVGETDPVYHDEQAARAAGHPDIPAVPTFPVVLSFRAGAMVNGDPELGLDYSRVVHGEQAFSYQRPLRAGDRLLAAGRVAAIETKGRHELLTIATDITSEAGEPVCQATTLLISRGTAAEGGGSSVEAGAPQQSGSAQEPPSSSAAATVTAGEGATRSVVGVAVGDDIGELREPVDRLDLIRYAGASGDFNVIHWSDQAATAVGLPGVIAHGMYSMGVAARLVTGWAGDPAALRRLRVRFSAMIRPGQTLIVHGQVAELDGSGAGLRYWGEDEQGNKVLSKGEADLELAG
jgi:acyl dehydratase